ncbi:MAG: GNAT family acetyltransferase [Myxococcota bacterium]|nr:GNAT family acetyltransferase [Myxococcota bacterium]
MRVRSFEAADETAVVDLWRRCKLVRPWNDPRRDIARKARIQPELFLVGVVEGKIVASVMAGYDGHRGWINYLAVSPSHQRVGLGRALMAEAERRLEALGCPKVNLQVRADNPGAIEFYRRAGYQVDDVIGLGKRLVADQDPNSGSR